MSTWQDMAKIAVHDVLSESGIARWGWLFVSGARWQREQLLTDDVIERAAETMFAYSFALPDEGVKRWGSAASEVKQMHRIKARAALTAAIEGEES